MRDHLQSAAKAELTNAMFLHEGNEVRFSEQLRGAGLPFHHLHRGGLEAGALLVEGDNLQSQGVGGKEEKAGRKRSYVGELRKVYSRPRPTTGTESAHYGPKS